jgi:hypothetical protein
MEGERLWRPDFSDQMPDGQSDVEVWDCKALSGQRIVTLFRTCEEKYREWTGKRNFHLCLFDPKQKSVGDLVVCRATRYADLLAAEEMCKGLLDAITEFDPPGTDGFPPGTDPIVIEALTQEC